MPKLVRVPWDQRVWVEQATLDLLVKASQHAGHNIQLSSSAASLAVGEGNGGWRSWDSQNTLYIGWIKGWAGYNVASNPDTGLRQHMRGAAVDIANKADRIHMLAVGFKPDGAEWWHFNHPNWANMPIIRNLAAAGLSVTPILKEEDIPYTGGQSDQDKINQASDIINKPVLTNIDGVKVSLADVVNQLERNVRVVYDMVAPGIAGVREDGYLHKRTSWAFNNTDALLQLLPLVRNLPGSVWDFPLERPTGPANANGSRPVTRAGDFQRYAQAYTDSITAAVVASGGKPLTDAQARDIAAIIASRIPQVNEDTITTRVVAGIRDLLRKAIA